MVSGLKVLHDTEEQRAQDTQYPIPLMDCRTSRASGNERERIDREEMKKEKSGTSF